MTTTLARPAAVKSPAERLADLRRDLADPAKADFRAEIRRAISYLVGATILEAD